MDSTSGSRPMTRRKAAEDLKRKEDEKRRRTLFRPRKVIGPRDILVDVDLGKVKVEEVEEPAVVVKAEPVPSESPDDLGDDNIEEPGDVVMDEEDIPMPSGGVPSEDGGVGDESCHAEGLPVVVEEEVVAPSTAPDVPTRSPEEESEECAETGEGVPNHGGGCSCAEEIKVLKEALGGAEKKLKERDLQIQKLRERVDKLEKDRAACGDDRVVNLFPQVLEVFWEKYAKLQENSKDYLNFNSRLVCKAWKAGMDELLTGEKSPIDASTAIKVRTRASSEWLTACLVNIWLESAKEENFPFPPRHLKITDRMKIFPFECQPADLGPLKLAVGTFLGKFGADIRVFEHAADSVTISDYGSWEEWYATFRSWLELMPHLQELVLESCDFGPDKGNLSEVIRSNPFPELKELTSLTITGYGFPQHLIADAVGMNKSIKNLSIQENFATLNGITVPVPHSLTSIEFIFNDESDYPFLSSLSKTPLEVLKMYIFYDDVSFPKIVDVVETFGSLRCLDINLPPDFSTCRPINIPNLQQLRLDVMSCLKSGRPPLSRGSELLRLTAPLSSLEHLSLYHLELYKTGLIGPNSASVVVSVRKILETRLLVKDLWNLLPALKRVEITLCGGGKGAKTFLFIREI